MEAPGSSQLESLADESLAVSLSFLQTNSIMAISVASVRFLLPSHADLLWLPRVDHRWHFGEVPSSKEVLLPGARQMFSDTALAEAALAPLHTQACVFSFFSKRCQQDADVIRLAIQHSAAFKHPLSEALPTDSKELPPGSVVRMINLSSAPKYNGCLGVIIEVPSGSGEGRFAVMLPTSLKTISIKSQNLVFYHPPMTEEEAQARVLEVGAAGIDALVRLAGATEPGTPLGLTARHLLARVTEEWAEQQWSTLLADPGRTDHLEEGGLIVSQWGEPGEANVAAARSRLAELASAVEARTTPTAPLLERVETVSSVLFEDWGFSGDTRDYKNPKNSFLHSVLERWRGIPISLSIVWVAVARRVNVPCFLLAKMPQHILIRVTTGGGGLRDDIFVDAFHRKIMNYGSFEQFAISTAGFFHEDFAAQCPAMFVYARLLKNLEAIYRERVQSSSGHPLQLAEALQRLTGVWSQALGIADQGAAAAEQVEQMKALRERAREHLSQTRRPLGPARGARNASSAGR
mmetsp:Transcript_71243/g.208833  ORF Transcript_71243/g.208833 Transcript_71243/m.208833 type:complete len:520 (+) Transcript_71243:75-1634(+)